MALDNDEFRILAERILLATVRNGTTVIPQELHASMARQAISLAGAFDAALKERERERERVDRNLTPAEVEMIRERQPIKAIKSVRERLGINLKEAKLIVDQFRFPY